MDLINNQKVIGTQLTGTNIKSHTVDPLTSSMTIGQLWQKSIDSPFIGLDEDNSYTFTNAQISVDGTILDPAPETMANSITFPKIQFGFWWEESVNSKIITTFFTGVSTFLPEWNFTNNESGDYKAGMPINISYPEVPEYFYYDRSSVGQSIQVFENTINQDYICHVNPAFNLTSSMVAKETGDIPGYKIDPRWDLCGNNFVNYNHGSWYETLTPDGQGNFTNETFDANGQPRFTPGKKFRVKVGQFDLWGQSSDEDWSLDECYILVRVKDSSDYTHLDPTGNLDHKKMPFMISNVFYQSSAYGVFNESFLGVNASMRSGGVRPYDSIAADVTCWESINKYVTQTPPFFFSSMSAPFSELISVHYTTNFDIFAYNFSEDNSKRPHYTDRYLKLDNLSTPFEYQSSAWVNQGYFKDEDKYTYSILENPTNSSEIITKRDNDGDLVSGETLEGLPQVMETEAYNGFAYYVKEVSGEIVPDFNQPKFLQGKGYFGDLGADPLYVAGTKTKFEIRLVDYIKQPFYWNKIFSSSTNSIRTLMGKMSTALIFTQEEYQDLYSVASPTRDGFPVCWPSFNEYGFNTFDSTVLSSDSPENKIGNTLIGEFLVRSKIASGFDWKVASDKNVYTWINKISNNSGTAKYVPAYDLMDFHRVNIGEVISSITPQVSLKTISPTTSAPTSVNPETQTEPSPRYTLQEKLSESVKVWHKGVKIPIYIRILDYPYTKTLNNRSYQGLGTTAETGNAFSVFLSGMLGYTASYNQSTGLCENSHAIDYYTSWHTPGPNTIQQHAGQKNASLGDLGKSSPRTDTFGVHQGTSDGAVFYDSAGNAETSLIEPTNNQTYNSKYKTVLDKNQGALWRYPEAISSAYSFSNKDNKFHRIGYVQFPKTPHVGEGYIKEIAMLAVKNNTDDSTNITNAISSSYSTSHLMADTGDVMIMTGGMCKAIEKLAQYMDAETAETQIHNAQAQYSIKPNGTFSWYNDSVPAGFTQKATPEDDSYTPYIGSGNFENDGMYKYDIPASNYNAFASTITQQEYFALPGYPVATDVNDDGAWLATEPNRKMYNFSADSSKYNPNTFAAQNHIGDDDIAVVHDNAAAVAHGISTKLGEYMTNCSLESFKIKVIDQPYFFAQAPRYSGDVFFGNYKHTTDLSTGTTSNTVGRFYFYEEHDQLHSYEPMSVGIPALLERTENIPGAPTVKSKSGSTVLGTYTPPRADYLGATAVNKSFIRSFNLVKASSSGTNGYIGMNAVDGATRSLVIDDTVADGAGVKTLSGICVVKNPPTINSVPNRQNFGKNAYMIFYNSDAYDNAITFSFPFNGTNTGHAEGYIDIGGTGLTTNVATSNTAVNIHTSDLTSGNIDIVLDDFLRLSLPDEISSISYGGSSFLLTDSILNNEAAIQAVYQNVLGRAADQGGLDNYKLENYSVNVAIDHFMESNEYKGNLYDGNALPDPRGNYRAGGHGNQRSYVSMTPITIDRSTMYMDNFINHKNGHLWVYKDRSIMYGGAHINNPAAIDNIFGNIWAEDSFLRVYWNDVSTHAYHFVYKYTHNTTGQGSSPYDYLNLSSSAQQDYTFQNSYDPSGNASIAVNKDWFIGSSDWTNTVKFEVVDGTNLPTPFSKSLPASYSVRGIKVPEVTNFNAGGTEPANYKLYLTSVSNFLGEPSIPVSWSAKVYSDIAYTGSSDSHFYDHGIYRLTFNMPDGTEVIKNISKGIWQTPSGAGLRNFSSFNTSYSLSNISPVLNVPTSVKLTVSDEIFAYPYYDQVGDPVFTEVTDSDLGLSVGGNYILNKLPGKTIDTWQFKDQGGIWRDFNLNSHNTNGSNLADPYSSDHYILKDSLLKGTGATTLTFGSDSFEGASEALLFRQRVFYAPLCVMPIFNCSNPADSLRLHTTFQNSSNLTNMINRGVDTETNFAFDVDGAKGAYNNYYASVPGPLEYNYWSLPGVFNSGKYSDVRRGWCIDLTSPTPNDVFESTWDQYGPVSKASVLPPVGFRGADGNWYSRNIHRREITNSVEDSGFSNYQSSARPRPSNNNWGRGDASLLTFSEICKSEANYLKPCFITTTKIRGWQTSNLHDFIYDTSTWDPEVKTWQENIDAYQHAIQSVDGYGPHIQIISQGSTSSSHDETAVYNTSGTRLSRWAPWGTSTSGSPHHLNSNDLWSGGYGDDAGASFIGRKSKGYMGFQMGATGRIVKRVNGVFPGVTYRLYFTAAYRPHYWNQGCRVYVTEPYMGQSEPENGDAEHDISRELIAYGEYTGTANRWINYNVKRNVTAALGREWIESDGYGFTCNLRKQYPYKLNSSLSAAGDNVAGRQYDDDTLKNNKFKVFYIEFTPKKGSTVVEITFEQAFMKYHQTVNWQANYSSLSAFNTGILNGDSAPARFVPSNWVEIEPDDFFDPSEYTKDYVRKWDHPYRGPWEASPRPWRDGFSTFNDYQGAPGGVHATHSMQRIGAWFLDEIWMTTARPCWVEKVKFKYNVHQGGYLLSIDQGDKANRPVDDVFLANPNLEVIERGGLFPENFEFGTGKLMNPTASLFHDNTNGYFVDGEEYEIDIIRQHTHIQNWDPFAVDNDNFASKFLRTNSALIIPWIPGDYHAGLVFSPPNPGLFKIKSTGSINNSARFGMNNVSANQDTWRGWMPTTSTGYNSNWEILYTDPDWNTGAGAVTMPGWNDLMNTISANSMSVGESLIRNPKMKTITPINDIADTVFDGATCELDTSSSSLDVFTSYEHTIIDSGVYVNLPVLGRVFFLDKDKLGDFTGNEASVDFSTGKLYEGTFALRSWFGLFGIPDYEAYVDHPENGDLANVYNNGLGTDSYQSLAPYSTATVAANSRSKAEFGEAHWLTYGHDEDARDGTMPSNQYAAIAGLNPVGNYGGATSYQTWADNLPAWSSRNTIFPDGKIFIILENNSHPSGQLGKQISDTTGSSYLRLFTSSSLWPWFKDIGADKWGVMELNKHRHDLVMGNQSTGGEFMSKKILWWDEGFPVTHWKKWQIGSPQNMSPITRGSDYDKFLKNGFSQTVHHNNNHSGGWRTNKNWIGDYIVVNHGALLNLFLARPISVTNGVDRASARPAPTDNQRNDYSPYHFANSIAETTHNNDAFRFL